MNFKRIVSMLLAVVMILGCFSGLVLASEAPLSVAVGGNEITGITESALQWVNWDGSILNVTCYTVTVPQGATEATLTFDQEMTWTYYSSTGEYIGAGDSSWTASTELTPRITTFSLSTVPRSSPRQAA